MFDCRVGGEGRVENLVVGFRYRCWHVAQGCWLPGRSRAPPRTVLSREQSWCAG